MFQEWLKDYEKLKEENNMSEEEIIGNIKWAIHVNKMTKSINGNNTHISVNVLQGLLDLYNKEKLNSLNLSEQLNKEKEKNKELEKYDYRKIKLDEKDEISSIHFTKEQLDLMNLGIALYVGIPKILADKEDEETDI